MNKKFKIFFACFAVAMLSLACGFSSVMPDFPDLQPTPGTENVPTGSSPMSGDWQVNAEFGHFAFTVDPDGKVVTTATFDLSNWTCGGTTISTSLQSLSQWPITDGQFGGMVNLNGSFHTMTVQGAYDETGKTFRGVWEQDAHGSICKGEWEAIPR